MRPHFHIGNATNPGAVLEMLLGFLVARGEIEVSGAIGERINASAAKYQRPMGIVEAAGAEWTYPGDAPYSFWLGREGAS